MRLGFLLLALPSLVLSCAHPLLEEIPLQPDFGVRNTGKTATVIWTTPRGVKHALPYYTNLDHCKTSGPPSFIVPRAFQKANPALGSALTDIESVPYLEKLYTSTFTQALQSRGIRIVDTQSQFGQERIQRKKKGEATEPRYDFAQFAQRHALDYIFLLELRCFGAVLAERYTLKPGDSTLTLTFAVGSLIDTATDKILWQYPIMVKERVEGQWNQPPNYPTLTRSIVKTLERALSEIYYSFFKQRL